MNRRLFIGKIAVAGLAVPFLPAYTCADPSVVSWHQQAADDMRKGYIGHIQHIQLMHTYHPGLTSANALLRLAQQDFDIAGALAGISLPAGKETLFKESPSSRFGSYATQFQADSVQVTWQGLARYADDLTPPTRIIRLFGSKGVLSVSSDGLSYEIQDFNGRVRRQITT